MSRSQSLDSLEVEETNKADLDNKYENMKKAEHFKLWLDERDPKIDEDFVNSERYAKYLKQQ